MDFNIFFKLARVELQNCIYICLLRFETRPDIYHPISSHRISTSVKPFSLKDIPKYHIKSKLCLVNHWNKTRNTTDEYDDA